MSFKEGETLTVVVKDRITAHTAPVQEGKRFSFRIERGAESEGELRVASTEPGPGAVSIPAGGDALAGVPRVHASFNRTVSADGLTDGITVRELRDFCAARLADFKVPRQIEFVTRLSRGPMGEPSIRTPAADKG